MSLGYAEKLSYIEDVGEVGMKELFEPSLVLQEKIERLAVLVKKSKHLVVFTGAGISTSSGIPDFRGPKGIWTLQIGASYPVFREIEESCQAVKRPYFCYFREGKALPQASLPFHRAMPSMTHMALVELEKAGILKFIISQNVDGLHLRSGIPREKLAELHGNSFMETCPSCRAEYICDFEVETIGLKETSRHCAKAHCKKKLRDTVLDWEDALPQREMSSAEKHCKMADLVLCLGTSLQITPACNLPLKSLRGGGKIVIVNLQRTPKDGKASLVIHGLVDRVIAGVMNSLNLQICPFVRVDFVQIILNKSTSADERFINWTLRVASVRGPKAPLSFVKSIEITFLDEEKYKAAVLEDQPFLLKRRTGREREFEIRLRINFTGGCGCPCTEINIPFDLEVSTETPNYDREAITQSLRDAAAGDSTCGRNATCGRKINVVTRSETTTYAIVTNVVTYAKLQKAHEVESTGIGGLKSWTECFGMTIKRKRSRR